MAVKPQERVLLGDALAALGRRVGLTAADADGLVSVRDKTPAKPLEFK
jgi:hypothetical protein